jgi:DNA-formamidopyrimidine glycosylase
MPEGPEVANFVRSVNAFLGSEAQLLSIEPLSGRYLKFPLEGLSDLEFPLQVEKVACKGKFIYWTFKGSEKVVFNTLGMTGSWSNVARNARVRFRTSEGDLYFNDHRNFGTVKVTDRAELKKKLLTLGPDMLNEEVSPEEFTAQLCKVPRATLAEALMNQKIVSGVGNYLKADSLWLARLSPHRLVSQCSDEQLRALCEAITSTIRTAYLNGGSTILTYKGFDGEEGKHRMLVYGRKTDPNGEEVVPQETKDGRTTWWVPRVQV